MDRQEATFITPEQFTAEQARGMESCRGKLIIASCSSADAIAGKVVERYNEFLKLNESAERIAYLPRIDGRFSDSETAVRLNTHISGHDVFLFQSLYNPVNKFPIDQNYMAFLIAARSFREHGARHITAVLPYLAYARQDKPTRFTREPTTAKLMADLSIEAGVDRMISWNPHSTQIHGFYGNIPLNLLDPLTLFLEEFKRFKGHDDAVAVAPDAGASKLATHFGRSLKINTAIASKYRPNPEEVVTTEIIGNLRDKNKAIILDDIISSAGTIYAVVQKLVKEKGIEEIYLGISHNLGVGEAYDRLNKLHEKGYLKELVVTNSIPQTKKFRSLSFLKIRDLAEIFARTINRVHYNRSVSELFYED